MLQGDSEIELALQRVGELLTAQGRAYSIAVIGGAAVNLLGHVRRATADVDILAFADQDGVALRRPDTPLPEPLVQAARVVAGDLGLDPNWLNSGPALQWQTGLPPGLEGRIEWRVYSGLRVGLVGRYDLIFFKLYAAVDDIGPGSVHFQDLVALRPTASELEEAARWVRSQDPSDAVSDALTKVIAHVDSRQ